MVVAESTAADAETFNRREVWRITLEKSLEVVNKMYGLNITFKMVEPDFDAGLVDDSENQPNRKESEGNATE